MFEYFVRRASHGLVVFPTTAWIGNGLAVVVPGLGNDLAMAPQWPSNHLAMAWQVPKNNLAMTGKCSGTGLAVWPGNGLGRAQGQDL